MTEGTLKGGNSVLSNQLHQAAGQARPLTQCLRAHRRRRTHRTTMISLHTHFQSEYHRHLPLPTSASASARINTPKRNGSMYWPSKNIILPSLGPLRSCRPGLNRPPAYPIPSDTQRPSPRRKSPTRATSLNLDLNLNLTMLDT